MRTYDITLQSAVVIIAFYMYILLEQKREAGICKQTNNNYLHDTFIHIIFTSQSFN